MLTRLKPGDAKALLVMSSPFFTRQRERIAELALKAKLVTSFSQRTFVDAGGLFSYGSSLKDAFTLSATYVDKIFKGAKPGELPIEQPTLFELVVNQKTAKALGFTFPQAFLLQVHRVIE